MQTMSSTECLEENPIATRSLLLFQIPSSAASFLPPTHNVERRHGTYCAKCSRGDAGTLE